MGVPASTLADDDPVWGNAGDYLAQLCMSLVLVIAPQRIALGGGVGDRTPLLHAARRRLHARLNGYIDRLTDVDAVSMLLVQAELEHAGLMGALHLARVSRQREVRTGTVSASPLMRKNERRSFDPAGSFPTAPFPTALCSTRRRLR